MTVCIPTATTERGTHLFERRRIAEREGSFVEGMVLDRGSSASLPMVDLVQPIVASLFNLGDQSVVHAMAAALALRLSIVASPGGVVCSAPEDGSSLDLYRP